MSRIRHSRLQTPAAAVLAGTGIACAFAIRQNWATAIIVEVVTLCLAAALYLIGGQDTDLGAVLGQQDDERQQLVALRAAQLALVMVFYALVAACVIAAAAGHAFWPFEILVNIPGVAYLIGLAVYGVRRDDPLPRELSPPATRPSPETRQPDTAAAASPAAASPAAASPAAPSPAAPSPQRNPSLPALSGGGCGRAPTAVVATGEGEPCPMRQPGRRTGAPRSAICRRPRTGVSAGPC